jgi:hypothetical protein
VEDFLVRELNNPQEVSLDNSKHKLQALVTCKYNNLEVVYLVLLMAAEVDSSVSNNNLNNSKH